MDMALQSPTTFMPGAIFDFDLPPMDIVADLSSS